MAVFDFSSEKPGSSEAEGQIKRLGHDVLIGNAEWFIAVRWFVVAALALLGIVGAAMPGILAVLNLRPMTGWMLSLAAVLGAANIIYLQRDKALRGRDDAEADEAFLWMQILTDLMVLTVLVHISGSIETFIAFTYLFHIVLSCIFFPRRCSFLVTLIASLLYLGCCFLESAGILSSSSMLINRPFYPGSSSLWIILYPLSAVGVFYVVWYLVSTISLLLRRRELELTEANDKLKAAEKAQTRRMLQTTHDLKAPFSGIETDIMVMRCQNYDDLPDNAKEMLERIESRSRTLRERIKEILLLGDLKNRSAPVCSSAAADLQDVFKTVAADLDGKAKQRDININIDVPSLCVTGDERKLEILFGNITSNAVTYSRPGGEVDVTTQRDDDNICVLVQDYGIGIKEEALPRIFDEFYNSKEAALFNKQSTGLGLAIVKEIASESGYRIEVESRPDEGTAFKVHLGTVRSEASRPSGGESKVQIIDDEPELADDLKIILENKGYDVSVYYQIEGAVDELRRNRPDVLLLDVMFPGAPSGGFDLAREIRLHEEIADLPIILLTSINQEQSIQFSPGDISEDWMPVQDFMEKPVNPDLLTEKINELIKD